MGNLQSGNTTYNTVPTIMLESNEFHNNVIYFFVQDITYAFSSIRTYIKFEKVSHFDVLSRLDSLVCQYHHRRCKVRTLARFHT